MLGALGLGGAVAQERWALISLFSSTVALRAPGAQVAIARDAASQVVPGTRILHAATHGERLAADEAAVIALADAASDAAGLSTPHRDLLRGATLDLHVLGAGLPAPVASWSEGWRLVWPRDTAHVAVAWQRLGRGDHAAGMVHELAVLAGADGWFEARYSPAGAEVPDGRPRQLDGTGWFLWALDEVRTSAPDLVADAVVVDAARRAVSLLLDLTLGGDALPPASPDYWEVPEVRPTIATCALVEVGLARGARILAELGDDDAADEARERAAAVRAGIAHAFGPTGYGRYAGRAAADAGLMFLLPPYALEIDPAVAAELDAAQLAMARPAGGVAPGALWRRDGVTWTPQTAMFAQARAHLGDAHGAAALLTWLADHRTSDGSLPEKVLGTGEPASVAPLGWTAALVVVALLA
ncbi:hypothetical protein ACT3TZ_06695 [Brachybacterium sp. AOP25-B2-12]|uniref:hypothetical protein n=1 Tax=Brachybacterium sp. AOP25-B2-12 TaxID=3457710 RepID=UPI0040336898